MNHLIQNRTLHCKNVSVFIDTIPQKTVVWQETSNLLKAKKLVCGLTKRDDDQIKTVMRRDKNGHTNFPVLLTTEIF